MKHLFSNPSFWRAPRKNSLWSRYTRYMTSKSATQAIEIKEEKSVHRHHWKVHENLVLIAAKEKQEKEFAIAGLHKTSNQKWEEIAVFCNQNGINRTGLQCKDKWHRLFNAFSKIRNWESCRPPGKKSFWQMKSDERNAEGFCFKLDKQVFDAIDKMNNAISDPFNVSTNNEGQPGHDDNLETNRNSDGAELHISEIESSGVFEKEIDCGKPHSSDGGDSTIQLDSCTKEVGIHDCGKGQDEIAQHDEEGFQDERPPLIVNTILKCLNQLKQLE